MNAIMTADAFKTMDTPCPYCRETDETCAASISSMKIMAVEKVIRCLNENYDNCPIFLAKILRRR